MITDYITSDAKKFQRAAYLLKSIAHPARIQIIQLLQQHQELDVTTLYQKLNSSQSVMSHHLINMRDKGVLDCRRQGKNIYYFLTDESMPQIINSLLGSKLLA